MQGIELAWVLNNDHRVTVITALGAARGIGSVASPAVPFGNRRAYARQLTGSGYIATVAARMASVACSSG